MNITTASSKQYTMHRKYYGLVVTTLLIMTICVWWVQRNFSIQCTLCYHFICILIYSWSVDNSFCYPLLFTFWYNWVNDTLIHKTWVSVLWTTRYARYLSVFYILIKYLCDNKKVSCGIVHFAHIECRTGFNPKPRKSLIFAHCSRLHQKLWLHWHHTPCMPFRFQNIHLTSMA